MSPFFIFQKYKTVCLLWNRPSFFPHNGFDNKLSWNKTSANKEDFTTRFESSLGTETPTYEEVIYGTKNWPKPTQPYPCMKWGNRFWKTLACSDLRSRCRIFDGVIWIRPAKTSFVNNGIHPGKWRYRCFHAFVEDLAQRKLEAPKTLLAVIPIYNIGGALNRKHGNPNQSKWSKGIWVWGNARNYDLNRDFIKADTKTRVRLRNYFTCLILNGLSTIT